MTEIQSQERKKLLPKEKQNKRNSMDGVSMQVSKEVPMKCIGTWYTGNVTDRSSSGEV